MDRIHITLTVDLTNQPAEGPGWYLRTWHDDHAHREPITITNEQAERICAAIDFTINDSQSTLTKLAQSGNKLVYNALEQQLKEAEEQATKISGLRKRLSEFTTESNDQEK